jgi:hypothetical protein
MKTDYTEQSIQTIRIHKHNNKNAGTTDGSDVCNQTRLQQIVGREDRKTSYSYTNIAGYIRQVCARKELHFQQLGLKADLPDFTIFTFKLLPFFT